MAKKPGSKSKGGYKPKGKKTMAKTNYVTEPQVKAIVKKEMDVEIEDKFVASQNTTLTLADSLSMINFVDTSIALPLVAQGFDTHQRIGDKIRPKTIKSHFTLYFDSATVYTQDIYVRLIVATSDEVKNALARGSYPGRNLLDNGDGTNLDPPGGVLANLERYRLLPVNKKAYNVMHDKVHVIRKNEGQLTGDGSNGTAPNIGARSYKAITVIHKNHPKTLTYDISAVQIPNNYYPFYTAFIWTGSGAAFSGGLPKLACRNEIIYQDA